MSPSTPGSADPAISVVIPTIGRDVLPRAVASVLAQEYTGDVEVIVVNDSGSAIELDLTDSPPARPVRVINTAGRIGGSGARNMGVEAAAYDWIAFLDDDDEFLPKKLATQISVAVPLLEAGHLPVLTSQHLQQDPSGHNSEPIPKYVYSDERDVAEYLFVRRRPGGGRASMYTSTLLCPKELATNYPWDGRLRRHQDWDFIVRLSRQEDVVFAQVNEPLTRIHVGTAGSISAMSDWESSLAWATSVLLPASPRVFVDFVAGQSLRYAFNAHSFRGVRACVGAIARSRRFPSLGPTVIALSGLLPRAIFARIMGRIR